MANFFVVGMLAILIVKDLLGHLRWDAFGGGTGREAAIRPTTKSGGRGKLSES